MPEDIVGADVDQRNIQAGTRFGQVSGAQGVDGRGPVGLGFGSIDKVVRGRINHQFRMRSGKNVCDFRRIGNVDSIASEGNQLSRKTPRQRSSQLAARSNQCNSHGSILTRQGTFASFLGSRPIVCLTATWKGARCRVANTRSPSGRG